MAAPIGRVQRRNDTRPRELGMFLLYLGCRARLSFVSMLTNKFVTSYALPLVSKPSKRTPHEHHWVSDNIYGQIEFERWTCAWCGQKRIRVAASLEPQLVRDWLEPTLGGAVRMKDQKGLNGYPGNRVAAVLPRSQADNPAIRT